MALWRIVAVGGVVGVAGIGTGIGFLHSRWGPRCRASVREFHRAAYNQPPAGWTGPVFKPKLDFATARPAIKDAPWEDIDFKTEPKKYMEALLEYCLEDNVENDFVVQKNSKRQWFHAPWMCQTPLGREPIHGLTFERPSPRGYLSATQTQVRQNWAVSVYNDPGW